MPWTIALTSGYDNYLELYQGESTTIFMENDDGGNGLNALITANLAPGVYYIVARPYGDGSETPTDPWGNSYQYEFPSSHDQLDFPDIWSLGADSEEDSGDELINWKEDD